jgi:hypothetical protein
MKAKSVIAAGVEYDLVIHLGLLFSALLSALALSVVLGALLRAPQGYEDEKGFRIGAPA